MSPLFNSRIFGPLGRTARSRRRTFRLESLETRELLAFDMTPYEQLLLELVNRARADPVAEIARAPEVDDLNDEVNSGSTISADPKQPLAPHQSLIDGMRVHTVDMLGRDFFGHTNPDNEGPSDRARDAGYPVGAGENIAWFGNTTTIDREQQIYDRHIGLVESVGHRINMMRENWREIGPGVSFGTFTQRSTETDFNSIMVGTLFGDRRGDNFITGVAITDHIIRNEFYEIGEGIGDVTITATREGSSETYTDTTGNTGGYSLRVPDGTYTVTATGGNLSRSITVRAIEVDGKNVKIDFNNAGMRTLYIDGHFFDDANGNGSRDADENAIVGRTAWLDLNEDGQLDSHEPRVVSDANGRYRIDGLMPGSYTVRQVLPNRWTQTVPPSDSTYVIPLDDRNLIGVDFGSLSQNESPVARNDVASVVAGTAVTIGVTQNDSDAEGNLAASSIQVASPPANGSVSLNSASQFVYTPNAGFSGSDRFTYTIADTEGKRSSQATVNIQVTPAVAWHNSAEPLDVNRDGIIAAQDVLIVIRELNRNGPQNLEGKTAGDYAWDVSGDDYISAIDALRIIIYLNRLAANGEPPELPNAAPTASAPPNAVASDLVFALAFSQQADSESDEDADDSSSRLWITG